MKINISYRAAGTQKQLNITDQFRLRAFYDKRISHEVPADSLGPEWKGYVLKITGGSDKCGTPMMQGVLTTGRVSLLLGKGSTGVKIKRQGVRLRKTVHGCIVDPSLTVINAVVVKKGSQEIPGLTDTTIPRRLGPKRAGKIRSIFKLSPQDDVRKYVIRRKAQYSNPDKRAAAEAKGVEYRKAPKIQRLVTTKSKRRTKVLLKKKQARFAKSKKEAENYHKLVSSIKHQQRQQAEQHHKSRRNLSGSAATNKKSSLPVAKPKKQSPAVKPPVKKAKQDIHAGKSAKPLSKKPIASKKPTSTPVSSSKKPIAKPAVAKGKSTVVTKAKPTVVTKAKPAKPATSKPKSSGKK